MNISKIKLLFWYVPLAVIYMFGWSIKESVQDAFLDVVASFQEWCDFRKRRKERKRLKQITRRQYMSDGIGDFMDLIMEGLVMNVILVCILPVICAPVFGYAVWVNPQRYLEQN